MKKIIYLDNNASTPLEKSVVKAIEAELSHGVSNPSSPHQWGQKARGRLDQARRTVASYFEVRANEVVFTSSGTEAMNFLLKAFPGETVSSDCEHSCVYESLKKRGETTFLTGVPTLEKVKEACTEKTRLICLMAVNNETGVKIDIERIASFAESHGIPFVVDGVAWLGKERVKLPKGVTGAGFSGHKIHAPAGIGCAIFKAKMVPLILGGPQELGLRAGTENMVGIMAFAKAIELLSGEPYRLIAPLRDRFEKGILERIPTARINGIDFMRTSNVSNILFPHIDGEALLIKLDQAGVLCSLGSACTSGALEPSRTLLSMGLPLAEARSSLRFSFGRLNTEKELDEAVSIIAASLLELS